MIQTFALLAILCVAKIALAGDLDLGRMPIHGTVVVSNVVRVTPEPLAICIAQATDFCVAAAGIPISEAFDLCSADACPNGTLDHRNADAFYCREAAIRTCLDAAERKIHFEKPRTPPL